MDNVTPHLLRILKAVRDSDDLMNSPKKLDILKALDPDAYADTYDYYISLLSEGKLLQVKSGISIVEDRLCLTYAGLVEIERIEVRMKDEKITEDRWLAAHNVSQEANGIASKANTLSVVALVLSVMAILLTAAKWLSELL